MTYPSQFHYTRQHEWIAAEGNQGTIGITDYAQHQLGDVVFVDLPAVGAPVKAGEAFGSVESVKAVSEIFAPVTGTVRAINAALAEKPELINQDPHGSAWLIKVEIAKPDELAALLNAGDYESFVAEQPVE